MCTIQTFTTSLFVFFSPPGAYGAHGLKVPPPPSNNDEKKTASAQPPLPVHEIWSRAVHYQQLHSVGLLLVPLLTAEKSFQRVAAGSFFTAGIALFSGGLYATGKVDHPFSFFIAQERGGGSGIDLLWKKEAKQVNILFYFFSFCMCGLLICSIDRW